MTTYEVFLKRDGKDEYRHAGALDAATDELATVLARECYVRRAEGDRIWLVKRQDIIDPDPEYLSANADKPHRHHSGEAVAARRKAARAASEDTAARAASEDTVARAASEDTAARAASEGTAARAASEDTAARAASEDTAAGAAPEDA